MKDSEPKFIHFNEKERETYLSQTGNFTLVERSLFHKLCEIWEPVISLNKFFNLANKDVPNAESAFSKFMIKLRNLRIGLISTDIVENKRTPKGVVLCEQNSAGFYACILYEEILNILENLSQPLPTVRNLQERNIRIPEECITKATYQQVAEAHVAKKKDSITIFAIQLNTEDSLIVPQRATPYLLNIQIAKMQLYFREELLMDLGASTMKMSLTEFRARFNSKEVEFWLYLSREFNGQREKLGGQNKVKLPDDLFSITYFLENFFAAQVDAAQKHRAHEQGKISDMQAVAEIVRNHDGYIAPREVVEGQLDILREKYHEDYDDFYEDFERDFLQQDRKKNLPVLLKIHDSYIHEENVEVFFLRRVEYLSRELLHYYRLLMSQYMKNSSHQGINTFNSTGSFETDIEDRVNELDVNLAALLKKPAAVAEAIIQGGRKTGRVTSVDDMKAILMSFFYPDRVKFKELQIIFNLDIKGLYKQAFLNSGIIKQLILRITGKHESYEKKFLDQSRGIYKRMINESALPKGHLEDYQEEAGEKPGSRQRARPGDVKDLPTRSATRYSGKRFSDSRGSFQSGRSKKPSQSKYSHKEQDKAWMEFSKRLKE